MFPMYVISLFLIRGGSTSLRNEKEPNLKEVKPLEKWVDELIPKINWCDKHLQCNDEENVMCGANRLEVTQHGKNCYSIKYTMTPERRRTMLCLHNELRNDVAGGKKGLATASNMRQLAWDVVLETTAKVWISYCRVGIAKCRKTPRSPEGTGQNYYLLGTDTINFDVLKAPTDSVQSFEAWISPLPHMKQSVHGYNFTKSLKDSAAQVILATASSVGCSEATYWQGGFLFRVLVCNYNKFLVNNDPLYTLGPSCSQCPKGTACNNHSTYPYLCALPDDNDNEGPPLDTEDIIDTLLSGTKLFLPVLTIHIVAVPVLVDVFVRNV